MVSRGSFMTSFSKERPSQENSIHTHGAWEGGNRKKISWLSKNRSRTHSISRVQRFSMIAGEDGVLMIDFERRSILGRIIKWHPLISKTFSFMDQAIPCIKINSNGVQIQVPKHLHIVRCDDALANWNPRPIPTQPLS